MKKKKRYQVGCILIARNHLHIRTTDHHYCDILKGDIQIVTQLEHTEATLYSQTMSCFHKVRYKEIRDKYIKEC